VLQNYIKFANKLFFVDAIHNQKTGYRGAILDLRNVFSLLKRLPLLSYM